MLWEDVQQPMYPLYNTNASVSPSNEANNAFFSSSEFKFTPQSTNLYEPQSFYAPSSQEQTAQTIAARRITTSAGSISSSGTDDEDLGVIPRRNATQSKKRKLISSDDTDEEKRKHFLERNRQAALKCRQRKKQWLTNLQERVEFLANDNEQLQLQANVLRDEVINLRNLLTAHKNCPLSLNLPSQYHTLYTNTSNKVFAE